jgi:hypothetical protein
MNSAIDHLAEKLAHLPPERIAEVIDFVDFLADREHERGLVRAAQATSQPALAILWNNDIDAVYDRL